MMESWTQYWPQTTIYSCKFLATLTYDNVKRIFEVADLDFTEWSFVMKKTMPLPIALCLISGEIISFGGQRILIFSNVPKQLNFEKNFKHMSRMPTRLIQKYQYTVYHNETFALSVKMRHLMEFCSLQQNAINLVQLSETSSLIIIKKTIRCLHRVTFAGTWNCFAKGSLHTTFHLAHSPSTQKSQDYKYIRTQLQDSLACWPFISVQLGAHQCLKWHKTRQKTVLVPEAEKPW